LTALARGSHLALSLERLDHVCRSRPARIGLSATQRPIELLEAVASAEQMRDALGQIAAQVKQRRTTLVFVNTRRMAERVAPALAARSRRLAIVSGCDLH
jgi:ATP-dependent helicase Lhr and Lhr-like helicase